jgi:glutaredoxin-related protein
VDCCAGLDNAGISYEFLDISSDLRSLKALLVLRDTLSVFEDLRGTERIGIPCIVDERGNVSLDWEYYVSQGEA